MSESNYAVLLVDPDTRIRNLIADQLSSLQCSVLHAADGENAFRIVEVCKPRLVVTELYLRAGEDDCLIHAVRRSKEFRKTRTIAHTSRGTAADRDWAMRAGADAYLIKPTRAERLRQVVARLATTRGANSNVPTTTRSPMVRRDTLDGALAELEGGALGNTSAIVFSRSWWEDLSQPQQSAYRKRAVKAGVSLRSDSMLGTHFVEVRGMASEEESLSTERRESPYRT